MKFEYKEVITWPVSRVYPVLRDQLVELPEFLPEVDAIEELERSADGPGRWRIVNHWHGSSKSTPAAVRPFVTKSMLSWKDHAPWIDAETKVQWHFETSHFETLYQCAGTNYVEDAGDGTTQLRLTGELTIHPDKLPGVPKILGKKLAPKIEQWLINMVTPNLAQMPKAIQAFLDRTQ